MGVMHGDEIEYVFGHPLNMSIGYNDRERDLSLRMMQTFARFALTGKPVPDDVEWPPYTKEEPKYYIFNADKYGMGRGPRTTACAFWNDFLPRLKNHPDSDYGCTGEIVDIKNLRVENSAELTSGDPVYVFLFTLVLAMCIGFL